MVRLVFAKLLLALCLMNCCAGAINHEKRSRPAGVWLETTIFDWQYSSECLSACAKPRLQLVIDDLALGQKWSASWALLEKSGLDQIERQNYVIFLEDVDKNLIFTTEIVGQDPSYGFTRACDLASEAQRPFLRRGLLAKTSFSLSGSCFNATIDVSSFCCADKCGKKPFFTAHCDTTTAPKLTNDSPEIPERVERQSLLSFSSSTYTSFSTSSVPIWLAFALLCSTLVLLLVCLLLLLNRFWYRRKEQGRKKLASGHSSGPVGSETPIVLNRTGSIDSEDKYDVPWEQRYRPLPHFLRGDVEGAYAMSPPVPPPRSTVPVGEPERFSKLTELERSVYSAMDNRLDVV